jgi:hypothetical protein
MLLPLINVAPATPKERLFPNPLSTAFADVNDTNPLNPIACVGEPNDTLPIPEPADVSTAV